MNDPQAAYLFLLMCGSTRANFLLRTISPDLTEEFATRHDGSRGCEGPCFIVILQWRFGVCVHSGCVGQPISPVGQTVSRL